MPNCWLEVSSLPEGPVTGQHDEGFPRLSSIQGQELNWYHSPTLHCLPLMQLSHYEHKKFLTEVVPHPLVTSKFKQMLLLQG
jgi:hypothetical protein